MRTLALPVFALSLAAGALNAQNLVANGDFEGGLGTAGNPKNWALININSGTVSSFATDGLNLSKCFNHQPGGIVFPNIQPNVIEQVIFFTKTGDHEFRCDLAARGASTFLTGITEVQLAGRRIVRYDFGKGGSSVKRVRLCVRFTVHSINKKMLQISSLRARPSSPGAQSFIDNVVLCPAPGPTVCIPGERRGGTTLTLNAEGNRDHHFACSLPVPVPSRSRSPAGPANGRWATRISCCS